MKFDDFDAEMRQYETGDDTLLELGETEYAVVRLDGRGFTKLTTHGFEKPFDYVFANFMTETTKHLMRNAGFRVLYGYTESDEISLLLDKADLPFNGKRRKLLSILAGEASAAFTNNAKAPGAFDARISVLPTPEKTMDYFRWRQADAKRNALNSMVYWTLRQKGKMSERQATRLMFRQSVDEKLELLRGYAAPFEDLEPMFCYGIGVIWSIKPRHGYNPITKQHVETTRRKLTLNKHLPVGDAYGAFIAGYL